MKKLLFAVCILFVARSGFSQIPGFSFGPKIGFNTNHLTTDFDSLRSEAKGSLQFGAFARFGKKIYVQPEVNYVLRGGKINVGNMGIEEIKMKSITVPLLIGYRLINAGAFNIRVMAGPTMSFVKETVVSKPSVFVTSFPIKSKDDLKSTVWSFQAGGGMDLMFMTLDVRYEFGVDNIYNGDQDFSLKNNLFNVSLGFKIM